MTDVCNEKIFDSKLITANDFTVKIRVTEEMLRKFEQEKMPKETDVKVNLYRDDLTEHIEQKLEEYDELSQEDTKIAEVRFGFSNANMLKLLEKRASALKNVDFKKAEEFEREMTQYKS